MKKTIILILLFAGLVFASCKKTYTCNCTLSRTHIDKDTSFTESYSNTPQTYSKKMTKKQAESACDHEEASVLSNYQSASSSFYYQTKAFGIKPDPNDQFTSSCTLK